MLFRLLIAALILTGPISVTPLRAQVTGDSLPETCGDLAIADACAILSEAARMLAPSYAEPKSAAGERAFRALGYDSQYIAAKHGPFQPTIDIFLVSKPNSNRLFIVITGTESKRDWIENAKFSSYTAKYEDGQFYVPPAHAGFRRGMLSIVRSGIFHLNEYDAGKLTLEQKCADRNNASKRDSKMTAYLCDKNVGDGSGKPIEAIIVGHSRGAGIGQVIASIVDGYELRGDRNHMQVARQENWPLRLHALVGFAPPYAIHDRIDSADNAVNFPAAGIGSHWQFLKDSGIAAKTVLFVNDRDIVPLLNAGMSDSQPCGAGRQFGHRYRITRSNAIVYEGTDWGTLASIQTAHSSIGYAAAVAGEAVLPELECRPSD